MCKCRWPLRLLLILPWVLRRVYRILQRPFPIFHVHQQGLIYIRQDPQFSRQGRLLYQQCLKHIIQVRRCCQRLFTWRHQPFASSHSWMSHMHPINPPPLAYRTQSPEPVLLWHHWIFRQASTASLSWWNPLTWWGPWSWPQIWSSWASSQGYWWIFSFWSFGLNWGLQILRNRSWRGGLGSRR